MNERNSPENQLDEEVFSSEEEDIFEMDAEGENSLIEKENDLKINSGQKYFDIGQISLDGIAFNVEMEHAAAINDNGNVYVANIKSPESLIALLDQKYAHICTTGAGPCHVLCMSGYDKNGNLVRGITHIDDENTEITKVYENLQLLMFSAGCTNISSCNLFAGVEASLEQRITILQEGNKRSLRITDSTETLNQTEMSSKAEVHTSNDVFMTKDNISVIINGPNNEAKSIEDIKRIKDFTFSYPKYNSLKRNIPTDIYSSPSPPFIDYKSPTDNKFGSVINSGTNISFTKEEKKEVSVTKEDEEGQTLKKSKIKEETVRTPEKPEDHTFEEEKDFNPMKN